MGKTLACYNQKAIGRNFFFTPYKMLSTGPVDGLDVKIHPYVKLYFGESIHGEH
jgi:hypothetical protein